MNTHLLKKYLAIETQQPVLHNAADNSTVQAPGIMMHLQNTLLFTYEIRMNNLTSYTAQAYKSLFTL